MFWLVGYVVLIFNSWQKSILWQHTGVQANVVCMQFSELWYCVLGAARRGVCQYCLLAVWPPATEHWQCTELATCQTNRQWWGLASFVKTELLLYCNALLLHISSMMHDDPDPATTWAAPPIEAEMANTFQIYSFFDCWLFKSDEKFAKSGYGKERAVNKILGFPS